MRLEITKIDSAFFVSCISVIYVFAVNVYL